MSNNQPVGAIIGLELLEKIRLEQALQEALQEYKAGHTINIDTQEDLKRHFAEMDKMV